MCKVGGDIFPKKEKQDLPMLFKARGQPHKDTTPKHLRSASNSMCKVWEDIFSKKTRFAHAVQSLQSPIQGRSLKTLIQF